MPEEAVVVPGEVSPRPGSKQKGAAWLFPSHADFYHAGFCVFLVKKKMLNLRNIYLEVVAGRHFPRGQLVL